MSVPFYIAKKYVNSRSKSSAINIITGITAIGILAGALVMFVVLSAFSGLREYSLQFVNGFDPDLRLVTTVGKTLDFTPEKQKKLNQIQGISAYSSYVEERVLLRYDSKEQIAYIKGVTQDFVRVNPIEDFIFIGEWPSETNHATVGIVIAHKLSAGVFDYQNSLEVLVPKSGTGSLQQDDYKKIDLLLTGVYSFQDDTMDAKYLYTDIANARYLLEWDSLKVSGIEFKLLPNVSQSRIKTELQQLFGDQISIKNRMELNDTLLKMLNTENLIVYLIITLVVIITLFTLIGTIIMVVLDKRQNLKTLYNIGMQIKDLRRVFLYQGVLLSFFGCVIGLFLGVIVVIVQQQFGVWMLTPTLPYPIKFEVINVFVVFATIMLLSFLASKIASNSVSKNLL